MCPQSKHGHAQSLGSRPVADPSAGPRAGCPLSPVTLLTAHIFATRRPAVKRYALSVALACPDMARFLLYSLA